LKICLSLVAIALATGPVWAQSPVEKLFARSRGLNPTLRDYSADLKAHADATLTFVPYHVNLNGVYYHKRPDKYKLDLKDAPSFLKDKPSVFGLNLPALERYNCRILEDARVDGRSVAHVSMTPKSTGGSDIQHIELYFDRSNGTVPRFDTYYSKGHLFLNLHWVQDRGFWVYQQVDADFLFPAVKATLMAKYTGYKFNQGLSDELFKK
jgi:hypothetical protein